MLKLSKGEYMFTASYIIVNISVFLTLTFELVGVDFFNRYYFVVGLVFFFFIFDTYHKSFRKKEMLLIWGFLALIQLLGYYFFKDYPDFQTLRGSSIRWLNKNIKSISKI